nr:RNA-directed DNA polymerase, eukaryota, reverse transcriptase zinc-binding domain protein [Tanacetum cinerariifolium]
MSVSHLFYADDAIFMGQWNQSNIDTIVRVLKVFHSSSGLRINMKKSKLMGIAVDVSRVEQAIRQIGCMALKMPFKYLGSVVGDRMSRVKSWNDVIDTLGIRARFFNGADNKVRKSSWVSWNQVMASKDAGGKNSLWAKVITAIHGDDGKIGKTVNPTFPSIWLNIIQEVAVMKTKGIDVSLEGSGEFSVSSIWKTIDAAFLPCDSIFLVELMSKISRWWDLGYQEINFYEELTDWMLSIRVPYNLKKVFEGVCYIVWWFIWDWRNQAIFGPGFRAKSMMFDDIVSRKHIIGGVCKHALLEDEDEEVGDMVGIMVDEMWIESPNRVKDEIFRHFSSRFDKPDARRAHIKTRYPKTLTCDQHVELESDVSNEKIKRAVWDCRIDKSPGLDGFTFGFYHRFWNLIENDVYDAVKYFFTYGVIPKGCNSSLIALIPKILDANTVKDFRPISLIGSIKLSSSLSISHMFYADDVVFVGQWCDGNITTLVHVLECFYRASGLRINMGKSKIMGVLVDSDKVKCTASKLGCLILKTPFSYLSSKVGGSMSRVHTWNEVVDRVKNQLSKWKMKMLSIGGRLTLLKSVLGSMPVSQMSIFRAPLTVLRTLKSIRSQFFKGQELNSKKAS